MTRLYARIVVWLRWPLLVAILAGVAVAAVQLPTLASVESSALGTLVPKDSRAVTTEVEASERLGAPILSRTLLVQRDADGFTTDEQLQIVDAARATTVRKGGDAVLGAVPVINRPELGGRARERNTTAITGLFFGPALDPMDQPEKAQEYVASARPANLVGVTGSIPAQVAQSELVLDRLPLVELATALLVALMVGLHFRSVVAPLMTLGAVGLAFLLTDRMLAQLALHADVAIPQEVHPVIVVLLFGVVTDYAIFFLSRARELLRSGQPRLAAAREATAGITGIVTAAAITVAGASMALYASGLEFLRAFGPGMAGSVVIAWLVVVLFVPVCIAILGPTLFWPKTCAADPDDALIATDAQKHNSPLVRFSVRHPLVMSLLCLTLLGFAVSGITHMRLGNPSISSLPADSEARKAYEAASKGIGPGAVAPTVLLVRGDAVGRQATAVASLERWLEGRRGVAAVLGPDDAGFSGQRTLALRNDEARFVLLFDHDPLGGRAVEDFRAIEDDLGGALSERGLAGARADFAGDTAVTAEMVRDVTVDLLRIGAVVLVVLFAILALYLRAIITPLYLLASSVLALLAALGLGTYIFQDLLGFDGLSYLTLITTGVLLVALGSDYNVFLVGDIWKEARSRPSREAITVAASRTSKPITVAGLVLALSFGLLILVPVNLFAEIAVVMFLGLLIDAFLVRTLLVPALISLFGSAGSWPGGRLRRHRDRSRLVDATEPPVGPPAA